MIDNTKNVFCILNKSIGLYKIISDLVSAVELRYEYY